MTYTLTIIVFIVFLLTGMPIAFVVGLAGITALLLSGYPLGVVVQRMFTGIDSFTLIAIPLFVLAGDLMVHGRMARQLVDLADLLVGRLKGGLAHSAIVASMIFSGVSGSATADVAAIGGALIPAMREKKYDTDFSAAVIASAGVMGPIIPPSLAMVIYSVTTGVSIGGLFMAGIVPGIMIGLSLMVVTYFVSRARGYTPSDVSYSRTDVMKLLRVGFLALLMPVLVVGGILSGAFTATESAGVAVIYALIVGLLQRTLKIEKLPEIFINSAKVSSVIIFLLATSNILSWILTVLNLPQNVTALLQSWSSNPLVFIFLVNIFLVIVGTFMDTFPALFLLAPILHPIAMSYGIDPLHFGLIVVIGLLIGLITPPVGTNLFVVCSLSKLRLDQLIGAIFPFFIAEVVVLFIVSYIPSITLWIPHLAGF